ncbi:ACT domain-containing protein [Heliorestis convoluta]|uniref:Amino acid-binding ACT domain protein n=1 Tax=Heliorestis convoluta TaxID=356322 RepID=A0A5Q2N322_9FIRM|nr:ACT domain-containing protein [Heliorestis convoluta]QGG48273.1 Amino acid-binding ACT domain protein [Heliorestis convoluta]
MKVQQISIFLENKTGRLAQMTSTLAQENINIRALSIADTTDFGILRLIVDRPTEAYEALKKAGFTVTETSVIALEVPDHPGGLASIMEIMARESINIEYLYALPEKTKDTALVIFRVEKIDNAIEVLKEQGIVVLSGDKVYGL